MQSNKNWFETWFNHPLYLQVYAHRDDADAKKLLNLVLPVTGLPHGSKVLDLACGAGRHSVLLAEKGFQVTGADLSENLLEVARNEASAKKLDITFSRQDMRFFKFPMPFDGIFNLFTSFGYFDDDRENFSVFKTVSDHLVPGGFFIFDYLNGSFIRNNLVPQDEKVVNGTRIFQQRRIEGDTVKKRVVLEHAGLGKLEFEESVKLYDPALIERVLFTFNLKVEYRAGDFAGNPLSEKSQRLILIARKDE